MPFLFRSMWETSSGFKAFARCCSGRRAAVDDTVFFLSRHGNWKTAWLHLTLANRQKTWRYSTSLRLSFIISIIIIIKLLGTLFFMFLLSQLSFIHNAFNLCCYLFIMYLFLTVWQPVYWYIAVVWWHNHTATGIKTKSENFSSLPVKKFWPTFQ